jgi:hypothetical protein
VTTSRTLTTLWLAAAISLLLAAPSLAAPAGDEYLPKVPEATGDQATSSSTGGTTTDSEAPGVTSSGGKDSKAKDDDDEIGSTSGPLATSSDDDDSSGGLFDTLFDPVVLLLIAGVIVTAVGMTLRRRNEGDDRTKVKRARRDPATAPPTPDGEIVTGGEKPSRP